MSKLETRSNRKQGLSFYNSLQFEQTERNNRWKIIDKKEHSADENG